ncbi:hypothetical protein [Streptomyces sp. WM6386]|nr:hypothetical protein [Streptomyces sp. WM6386]
MTEGAEAASRPSQPVSLWEDEVPSTDNSFLRIGPAISIAHTHEENE